MKKSISLCLLKPDAEERHLVEKIINDIQNEGFAVKNFVSRMLTDKDIDVLYEESKSQPYFKDLVDYMKSGVVTFFLVESSENAVDKLNELVGKTDPEQSGTSTLRYKYGQNILKNTIHSSNANRLDKEIEQLYSVLDKDKIVSFPAYFQLDDGTYCHTVCEECYENGKVIGVPKYFPTSDNGNSVRFINGFKYFKNSSIAESMLFARLFTTQKVKKIDRFGEELCVYSQNEIVHIFDPFETAEEIAKYNGNESILNDAKLLINIVEERLGIPLKDIGIEGSIMLKGYQEGSDIDVIIKGEKSVKILEEKFLMLGQDPNIHIYDESDIKTIFSRRRRYDSFMTLSEMLYQERRRTVGLINGRRFWLQPILGNNLLEFHNRKLEKAGVVNFEATVINSDHAFLWPTYYTVQNGDEQYRVECYDPVYMNQAKKGDVVQLRAPVYSQVGQTEKVIIFSPWNKEYQIFKRIKK